jgi:TPR repeat protein
MHKYELLDKLSQGTIDIVFKVLHKESHQLRCLKKIDLSKLDLNPQDLAKVVEALQVLNHPNIIQHYEHFLDGNFFCVAMEYVNGINLQTFFKSQRTLLPEDEILRIGSQIAAGISFIHSQRISHGNLKPDNVFLCSNGLVKIGNFDIFKQTDPSAFQQLGGTPAYFSPEIVRSIPFLYEIDCWAFGCILYELISLKNPFASLSKSASPTELFSNILNKDPKPLVGWYSPELFVLVEDLLRKDQKSRLSSSICAQSPIFVQSYISLGMRFQQGDGCKQDLRLSNFYLQLALNAANSRGPGWIYNATSTKSHQLRKLQHQFVLSMSQDDCTKYAISLIKGINFPSLSAKESYAVISNEAKDGNPFLIGILGRSLAFGYGTSSRDRVKAMRYYKKSANAGDPLGMNNYGISLEFGYDGSPPRRNEAMSWYKKSADAGNSLGINNYGVSLANGYDGSPPRKEEAMLWYKKSADIGNSLGMNNYGVSLADGFDGFSPRKEEAMLWYEKSADAGNSEGMNNYGLSLEFGYDGSPPRKEEAMSWYKKSADTGNSLGINNYGVSLANGYDGSPPRRNEAMSWYKKSADIGNSLGMNNYGIALLNGYDGFSPRKEEAMLWYKKSADVGSSEGMNSYGLSLEFGYDGLPPRKEEAMSWYKKSADAGNSLGIENYERMLHTTN